MATIVCWQAGRPVRPATVFSQSRLRMDARTGVRIAITAFTLIVLYLTFVGFAWTGTHQAPAAALASRIVLGISGLFALVALIVIWRPDKPR